MSIETSEEALLALLRDKEVIAYNNSVNGFVRYYYDENGIHVDPDPSSQSSSSKLPDKCEDDNWTLMLKSEYEK